MLTGSAPGARGQDIPPALKIVVYRHAPFVIHEVKKGNTNKRAVDHMLTTDFDGNRNGADNAANGANISISSPSTMYYAAIESGTSSDRGYYFINYAWYHANDFGFVVYIGPFWGTDEGHEHDMEGAFYVIKKTPYSPYGVIATVATEAHGALIPYVNNSTIVPVGPPAGEAGYAGYTEFWTDPRYGNWKRSVVAIRGHDHGSYMAQDCSGKSPPLDHGYGMWRGSWEEIGDWAACIHDDSQYMLYIPVVDGQAGSVLPFTTATGHQFYALQELATSTMWPDRFQYNAMFTGGGIDLGYGGGFAYPYFLSSQGTFDANPLWYWTGGPGQCFAGQYCYYSFGYDATSSTYQPAHWPTNYAPGDLISDPRLEAGLRFPSLPQLQDRLCYNPYVSPAPNCSAPPPLELSIMGPNYVSQYATNTWQAFVYGGTPPYSYSWSGALSGSESQVVGEISELESDDLFLTVTDAAGQVTYGSVSITVCAIQIPC